jgi:hypothetical protein
MENRKMKNTLMKLVFCSFVVVPELCLAMERPKGGVFDTKVPLNVYQQRNREMEVFNGVRCFLPLTRDADKLPVAQWWRNHLAAQNQRFALDLEAVEPKPKRGIFNTNVSLAGYQQCNREMALLHGGGYPFELTRDEHKENAARWWRTYFAYKARIIAMPKAEAEPEE